MLGYHFLICNNIIVLMLIFLRGLLILIVLDDQIPVVLYQGISLNLLTIQQAREAENRHQLPFQPLRLNI